MRKGTRFLIVVAFVVLLAGCFLWLMPTDSLVIVDGVPAELQILHVQKRGLRLDDVRINIFKDGEVYVVRSQRHRFHPSFESTLLTSTISEGLHEQARKVLQLQKAPGSERPG